MPVEGGQADVRVMDFATGDLRFEDTNQGFQFVAASIWDEATNGYVIPTGTIVKNPITVTLSSGTYSDGSTVKTILEGAGEFSLSITKPANQKLIGVSVSSGTAQVQNEITSSVFVSQIVGGGNITLTPTFSNFTTGGTLQQVNSGIDVALGTIKVRMASGGNRSMQISTTTGVNATLVIQSTHNGGGTGTGLANVTATPTAQYITSAYNFTTAGSTQRCFIKDTTNLRVYEAWMEVGASYNNNTFSIKEIY
jgi:hypothetical protein